MKRNIPKGIGIKAGLYKITNLINGKSYVGSTKHFSSRYRSHLSFLKSGKSSCKILQNAVNKYGIENFEFSILEVCSNYKEKEIEYFTKIFPSYNCIRETKIRREISIDTRKKMSESQKKAYKNGKQPTSHKGRKFIREKKFSVTLINDVETLNFASVEECAKHFNCTPHAIYVNYYRRMKLRKKYKVIINKT
jgi:hypothetical protein